LRRLEPTRTLALELQRPGRVQQVDGHEARAVERLEALRADGAPLDAVTGPAHERAGTHLGRRLRRCGERRRRERERGEAERPAPERLADANERALLERR